MTECPQCEALNQALMVAVDVIKELHSAIHGATKPNGQWDADVFTANMQRLRARAELIAATMKGEPCQGNA